MTSSYDELPTSPDPLQAPSRVLTVGAHPDDAEFGAGATLARWADRGAEITMCIVTDGSKGSWDATIPDDTLIATRLAEQDVAAGVLGVGSTVHLGAVDGELVSDAELVNRIARLIREVKPDVVLTHDPWQRYQLHPDHRATGMATVDAVVRAREPRFDLQTTFEAHRPHAMLLWSADEPNHAEPASDSAVQRKVEALLCHASQATTTMADATKDATSRSEFAERIDGWMRDQGRAFGVERAEAFRRLTP